MVGGWETAALGRGEGGKGWVGEVVYFEIGAL